MLVGDGIAMLLPLAMAAWLILHRNRNELT